MASAFQFEKRRREPRNLERVTVISRLLTAADVAKITGLSVETFGAVEKPVPAGLDLVIAVR